MQITTDPKVQEQLTKFLKMCKNAGMSQEEAVECTARMFSRDGNGKKFDVQKVLKHANEEKAAQPKKQKVPKDIWDIL